VGTTLAQVAEGMHVSFNLDGQFLSFNLESRSMAWESQIKGLGIGIKTANPGGLGAGPMKGSIPYWFLYPENLRKTQIFNGGGRKGFKLRLRSYGMTQKI
jgi:hypothetical protein